MKSHAGADVFQRGAKSRAQGCALLLHLAHDGQREDDRQERNGVHQVGVGLPPVGDDHAAQGGPRDGAGVEGNGLQRERIRQILARHKVGDQRLSGRQVERHGGRLNGSQHIDVPEPDDACQRQQAERQGDRQGNALRHEEDRAPIVAIRDQPADQREAQHGREAHAAHDAHGDGRPAQLADMPEQAPTAASGCRSWR